METFSPENNGEGGNIDDNNSDNVTDHVTNYVTNGLNETEKSVYELLIRNPFYTLDQLAEKTSKTKRTIQRAMNSLKAKGLLERVGNHKTGHWVVKS